jgi:ribosomal protein L29
MEEQQARDVHFAFQLELEDWTPEVIRENAQRMARQTSPEDMRLLMRGIADALTRARHLPLRERAVRLQAFCEGAGISDEELQAHERELDQVLASLREEDEDHG